MATRKVTKKTVNSKATKQAKRKPKSNSKKQSTKAQKNKLKKITAKQELDLLESEMTTVLKRTGKIQKKLKSVENIDKKIEQEEQAALKKEEELKFEEEKIEKEIFTLGNLTFKRRHLLELIRGTAGAFLGIGIGKTLLTFETLAQNLAWSNVIGILIFVLAVSSLLIYKNEQDFIKKEGKKVVVKRLAYLFTLALIIETLSLWLFGGLPSDPSLLIKWLIIGSYPAMAGAVSFSIA